MAEPRRRRHWPYRILIALGIVGILLLIAQDQETIRVDSPVAAADPRFVDYLATLIGTAPIDGNAYTVLRNGDEAYPAMLEAIAKARARISLESYVAKDGVVGAQFTAALAGAARRGVTVRLVLDSMGANLTRETQDQLTTAGVHLKWFNPLRFWTLEETNYRTHRKVLVVDGEGSLGRALEQPHRRRQQHQADVPARHRGGPPRDCHPVALPHPR